MRTLAALPTALPITTVLEPEPIRVGDWSVARPTPERIELTIRDDYLLSLGQGPVPVSISNLNTGHITMIDRQLGIDVNQDAQSDYRFWGAVTFKLETGEKVTVHTEPEGTSSNQRTVERVSVSGPYAGVIVADFNEVKAMPISLTVSLDGRAVDRAMKDNFTIQEAPNGAGWLKGKRAVTQGILEATAVGKYYGSGNNTLSTGQRSNRIIGSLFANLFSMMFHITGFDCQIIRTDEREDDEIAANRLLDISPLMLDRLARIAHANNI